MKQSEEQRNSFKKMVVPFYNPSGEMGVQIVVKTVI